MKIVYLSVFDGNIESGINKKMIGQVKALQKHYPDTELVYIINKIHSKDIPHNFRSIVANIPPFKTFKNKLKSLFFLEKDLAELLNIEMDVLYMRNPIVPTPLLKKLKKRNISIITELVSNTRQESLIRKSYINAYLMHYLYKSRLAKSNKIVGVTREICEKVFRIKNKHFLELGNGYNVEDSQILKENTNYEEGDLSLVCVANFSKWHGIDRLLEGLNAYSRRDKIKIYLVGSGNELQNIKNFVIKNRLENHVFFMGFLTGKELDEILSKAHIGIANLGIHRKKLTYTSPLKSREYCSKGIPFIYAGIDKDFLDFEFALRFEADDSPIDFEHIERFAFEVYKNENMKNIMRKYAVENLSYSSKVNKLISFMKNN